MKRHILKSLSPALLALALAAPAAAQTLVPGAPVPVYGEETERQGGHPVVAAHADGHYLAAWISGNGSLVARAFTSEAAGNPVRVLYAASPGPDVQRSARYPQVAPLSGGGYAVLFQERSVQGATSSDQSRILFLDRFGQTLSPPPTPVSLQGFHEPLSIAATSDGFLLAGASASAGAVAVRAFHTDGQPKGPLAEVGEAAPLLGRVSVAPLPEDRAVAAWSRNRLGAREAVLQIVESGGTQGAFQRLGPSLELESGDFAVLVSTNASGRIVAVWAEPNPVGSPKLLARFFDAGGQPVGAPIPVTPSGLLRDVELRDDGTFLVVWMAGVEILARAYGSDGLPLGPQITVNAGSLGYAAAGGDATVTPLGWMAVWSDYVASENQIVGPWVRSLETRVPDTTPCPADLLCLGGGRFRARVTWRVPATGAEGAGTPIPLTGDTGAFWFFSPSNYELVVKVLDGRGINGHFWIFYGSLTDVEFDLTVTDVLTGQQRTYHNPAGTMASHADTLAF